MKVFRALLLVFTAIGSVLISCMYFEGKEPLSSYAFKVLGLVGIMLIVSLPYIKAKANKHKR